MDLAKIPAAGGSRFQVILKIKMHKRELNAKMSARLLLSFQHSFLQTWRSWV